MPYRASKIYYDGSHYIAVPKENFPSRKGGKTARKSNLPKRERRKYVTEKLQDEFTDDKQAEEYVKKQTERKRNNAYKRYTRLWHKVYLQCNWNFFVTCTYSDEKHTEQTFQKTLRNTLKHLVSRKGWRYIEACGNALPKSTDCIFTAYSISPKARCRRANLKALLISIQGQRKCVLLCRTTFSARSSAETISKRYGTIPKFRKRYNILRSILKKQAKNLYIREGCISIS